MKSILKLGTRKSLLALAQSRWVAREIERKNPGVQVELTGIETRGDRILDIPLQKVEGKEFFVAEIDDALKSGRVDLTVHSLKDLSLERPDWTVCGAIPHRENPRDVILFGPHVKEKLIQGQTLKIGTSSPRRLENIPSFLEKALPKWNLSGKPSAIQFVEIRGNVNTRLSRVHEPLDSERSLDGVVLAFAGLIRLWNDSTGRRELSLLLEGVRWMVLPLAECPAAPGQGALMVECRADNERVREILGKLHHQPTATAVRKERQLLADWGGGCHQKFGATVVQDDRMGDLLWVRGVHPDGRFIDELQWQSPKLSTQKVRLWDGSKWRKEKTDDEGSPNFHGHSKGNPQSEGPIFVAHSRAVSSTLAKNLQTSRVWTSGVPSWFRLAEKGVWVEGCAEGMGFDGVVPTLTERVLQLAPLYQWVVLTHSKALDDWDEWKMRAIAAYDVNAEYSSEAKAALSRATHVFWSSRSQYDELKAEVHGTVVHACGPGKTAQHLEKEGIQPLVFPSVKEWREWLS